MDSKQKLETLYKKATCQQYISEEDKRYLRLELILSMCMDDVIIQRKLRRILNNLEANRRQKASLNSIK